MTQKYIPFLQVKVAMDSCQPKVLFHQSTKFFTVSMGMPCAKTAAGDRIVNRKNAKVRVRFMIRLLLKSHRLAGDITARREPHG